MDWPQYYNVYKKTDIDNTLSELKKNNYKMDYEYRRRKFILQLEKTEDQYEISEYFCRQFEYEYDVPLSVWDELHRIEKSFAQVTNAYEKKSKALEKVVEETEILISVFERVLRNNKSLQATMASVYIDVRKSDVLFYKNYSVKKKDKERWEEEFVESIRLYEKHGDLWQGEKELKGYVANTIGFSYLQLAKNVGADQKKEEYYKKAEKNLNVAVSNNSKGRYFQNLGSLHENLENFQKKDGGENKDYYEEAYECYKNALKADKKDLKIYNLLGSLFLKRFEKSMGINQRFDNGKLLCERKGEYLKEEDKELVKEAYNWLLIGLQVQEPVIDTYYNFAKACMYYWLFIEVDSKQMEIMGERYLRLVEMQDAENKGYLFTQRNYYEAKGEIKTAIAINKNIKGGDQEAAGKKYHEYRKRKMEELVDKWMQYHNHGAGQYTGDLLTTEDYNAIFTPVYQLYMDSSGTDAGKMFETLYSRSELAENLKKFIIENQHAAGMIISFGTVNYREVWVTGNRQELEDDGEKAVNPIEREAIFDLSSVTKLFTCIAVLKLVDMQKIRLEDTIPALDRRFLNLQHVTVEDLLTFKVPLKTVKRLETAQSLKEIHQMLFEIEPDKEQTRLYSDMGAMVLKYVVETVTGQTFYEWIEENILIPCKLRDTVIQIPAEDMDRVVSNNFERKVLASGYMVESNIRKGLINDGKARKINEFLPQLHGHAGMFSTADDMSKLVQALLEGKVLDRKWLQEIGLNRTGKQNDDASFTQFHGYLCYSKNPVERNSEVNHYLSGNAFALGGYTGNYLMVDPNNQIFLFMASNRCHNRVTYIHKGAEVKRDRQNRILWEEGKSYIDSTGYVYERDRYIVKPAIKLAMQYRFLEELLEQDGRKPDRNVVERKIV